MLDKVYVWLQEESISRTVALAGSAATASLLWLFRKKPKNRVNVVVDAPEGEPVDIHIGKQ